LMFQVRKICVALFVVIRTNIFCCVACVRQNNQLGN
jgi:hypothetical protein